MDIAKLARATIASELGVSGRSALRQFSHPNQRNLTFKLHLEGVEAIAKFYTTLLPKDVRTIEQVQGQYARAGGRTPKMLYLSEQAPFVVHEKVAGIHRPPGSRSELRLLAGEFIRQRQALDSLIVSWGPERPIKMPVRAQIAMGKSSDPALIRAAHVRWEELTLLARMTEGSPTHADWRLDNILWPEHGSPNVLDWESVLVMPWPEAAGYASASFDHSWRASLYSPFLPQIATAFARELREVWNSDLDEPGRLTHLDIAMQFQAIIRLAEDRERDLDQSPLSEVVEMSVS